MRTTWRVIVGLAAGLVAACAANAEQQDDDAGPALDASGNADSTQPKKDAQAANDGSSGNTTDAASDVQTVDVFDAGPPLAPIVYGHSPDTLYTFDTSTQAITQVAAFSGCTQSTLTQVIDLAIDSQMNAFVTTFDGFYSLDLMTAECSLIQTGSYPNSLSFVPAGTLDPLVDALVGYFGGTYSRIDTTSGAITSVGTLSGGYASSGDIVSVKGGGSFLTVTGNGCGDCLLQVDPSTGDLIQDYGSLPHGAVYGLAYWAGALYGFDQGGDVFSITGGGDAGLVTSDIVSDGGVMWWGAGSTTLAPAAAPDGGEIATQ
jgi:hypothetical protein